MDSESEVLMIEVTARPGGTDLFLGSGPLNENGRQPVFAETTQ